MRSIKSDERGFTYLDVMVGLVILMVGIVALSAAVTAAHVKTREGEKQLLAKQYAASTIESIFSARDMNNLQWGAIGNVGSNPDANGTPQGVFLTGTNQILLNVGPDGVVGTADDNGIPAGSAPPAGFQRQITITDYDDPDRPVSAGFPIMMRKVVVTIFYTAESGVQRQETASTMITNYSVQ